MNGYNCNKSEQTREAIHVAGAEPATLTRFVPALGLLAMLASAGCVADTEQSEVGSQLALGDTLADRTKIITGATDEREGWGRAATGGASGPIYHVTNLNNAGAGSLRNAAESPGPQWIIFDVSGTITLDSPIAVRSDKTVDGRGKQIEIRGKDSTTTAFEIHGQQNVILINLEFDNNWLDYDMDSEGSDAINIQNSHNIWIHHCEFLQWPDGAIDIKEYDNNVFVGDVYNVSVTWSRFRKLFQAMLWEGDYLSLGHSVCYNAVNARCPKIIGGHGHSYNNYIGSWGSPAIQHAKNGGQLYSQRNYFERGATEDRVGKRDDATTDKIELDNNYAPGVIFVGGSDSVSATFKSQSQGNARVELCSTSSCWTTLKDRLLFGDAVHAAAGNRL